MTPLNKHLSLHHTFPPKKNVVKRHIYFFPPNAAGSVTTGARIFLRTCEAAGGGGVLGKSEKRKYIDSIHSASFSSGNSANQNTILKYRTLCLFVRYFIKAPYTGLPKNVSYLTERR